MSSVEEINFRGSEKQQKEQQQQQSSSSSRKISSSVRDILQKVDSMLTPGLLRSVLAGNCSAADPKPQPLPVHTRADDHNISPLTIIYKGTASVFDATPDLAEILMKMAAAQRNVQLLETKQQRFLLQQQRRVLMNEFNVRKDMPLQSKKSLQRFFEKRRERRLVSIAPYPTSDSSSVGDFTQKESVNQKSKDINVMEELKKTQHQMNSSSSS